MVSTLLKAVFALLLLALLATRGSLQLELLPQLLSRPVYLALSVLIIAVIFPLSAWRWHKLLSAAGLSSIYRRTNTINYKAAFVGMYLPGGIGADIARLAISNAHEPGKLPALAATVVIDRMLGVMGLLFLGLLAALAANTLEPSFAAEGAMTYWLSNLPLYIGMALLLVLVALVALLAVLWMGMAAIPKVPMMRRFNLGDVLSRLHEGILLYKDHPGVLLQGFGISVAVHCLDLLALVAIANILLDLPISPIVYALAGVLSAIANSVPLTPGGIGVGEAAYSQLLNWFQPWAVGAPFATIYLAHRVIRVLVVTPGAFMLLSARPMRGN